MFPNNGDDAAKAAAVTDKSADSILDALIEDEFKASSGGAATAAHAASDIEKSLNEALFSIFKLQKRHRSMHYAFCGDKSRQDEV